MCEAANTNNSFAKGKIQPMGGWKKEYLRRHQIDDDHVEEVYHKWKTGGQRRRKILVHSEFEDESSSNDSSNDETDYDSDTDSDYDE